MNSWIELAISASGPILSAILLWLGKKIVSLITSVDGLSAEMKKMREENQQLHRRVDITDRVIGDILEMPYDSDKISKGHSSYPHIHFRKKDREY